MNGIEFTGIGRPPLVGYKDVGNLHDFIQKQFLKGDSAEYTDISGFIDNGYREKIANMTPEQREKFPENLRKNNKYEVASRLKLNVKTPIAAEKSRNDCASTGTIEYFFDNTYSDEMFQGVPKQLCFNADETSVEISLPRKIIIPQGEKEGRKIEKFNISCHISAMVTLNANGDDFAPYIIVPLKNLPNDLAPLIAGGNINIGGSPNGWTNYECFSNWSKTFIQRVNEIRKMYNFDLSQKAILFLDGHGSRNNAELMSLFKSENIEVIIFPPHLTHIIQPFDRVIARPLKDALSRIAAHLITEIDENEQEKIPVLRSAEIRGFIDAHRISTTSHNCETAFDACGLFPRNPQKVLSHKLVKVSKKNFIQTELIPGDTAKISGLCITSDDVRPFLRNKKSDKKEVKNNNMK